MSNKIISCTLLKQKIVSIEDNHKVSDRVWIERVSTKHEVMRSNPIWDRKN